MDRHGNLPIPLLAIGGQFAHPREMFANGYPHDGSLRDRCLFQTPRDRAGVVRQERLRGGSEFETTNVTERVYSSRDHKGVTRSVRRRNLNRSECDKWCCQNADRGFLYYSLYF